MVDPHNITKFDRTDYELEEFLLFCLAVAGKTAVQIAKKIDDFVRKLGSAYMAAEDCWPTNPLWMIRSLTARRTARGDALRATMEAVKLGKYTTLTTGYPAIARDVVSGRLDLRTCTPQELERYPGVGPKTARFFILHSRPGARVAVIDTHMMKFLRSKGCRVPKTLDSKNYLRLEKRVLQYADASGKSVADFDLDLWRRYTKTKPLTEVL